MASKSFGKYKLSDEINIEFDSQLCATSENGIQNRAVFAELSSIENNVARAQMIAQAALLFDNKVNQIIVTSTSAYYFYLSNDEIQYKSYTCMRDALSSNPEFEGKVSIVEPIEFTKDQSNFGNTTQPTLYLSNRRLTFDLNDNVISSNLYFFMTICDNSDITVQNGSIYVNSTTGQKVFQLTNGGKLHCKSLGIELIDNGSNYIMPFYIGVRDPYTGKTIDHEGEAWQYQYNSSGTSVSSVADIGPAGFNVDNCQIYIDRFCQVDVKNVHNGYDMGFWIFSPYELCRVLGTKTKSYENGLSLSALAPYVYNDGKVRLYATKDFVDSDTSMTEALYGTYGIGNDNIGWTFEIGPNGEMDIPHGHGIYTAAQNNKIIINGGRIVGYNGITVRGGHLEITENANPTVIGNGDYVKYNPAHNSGAAGSAIFLGHAVMIEACANEGNGYGKATATIKSGTFISKNNTSIASVAASKAAKSSTSATQAAWTAEGTNHQYYDRHVAFVEGGMMNRSPSIDAYSVVENSDVTEVYAINTDYGIIADGYSTSTPTMVVKNEIIA